MQRSRIVLAGVLAIGLVGSAATSASASDTHTKASQKQPATTSRPPAVNCPGLPGDLPAGAEVGRLDVKVGRLDVTKGKVYLDGVQVGTVPADGEPLLVAIKDGTVYLGKDAEALPKPALPPLASGTAGPGRAGPGTAGPGTAGPGTAGPGTATDRRVVTRSGGTASALVLDVAPGARPGPQVICVVKIRPGGVAGHRPGSHHQESGHQQPTGGHDKA